MITSRNNETSDLFHLLRCRGFIVTKYVRHRGASSPPENNNFIISAIVNLSAKIVHST